MSNCDRFVVLLTLSLTFLLVFLTTGARATEREKVIYAGAANISFAAVVAVEKGYFVEEGLDVDYQLVQTGKLAMEAVMSGRADFGSVVCTNVTYAGFQSDAMRLIASNGLTLDDAVVVPIDSPIHTASDLKGKKIGLALSTSSQDFLIHLLAKNGITWVDIKPVSLQPPTMLAALRGGQVDAVTTWQPWRAGIRKGLNGAVREINNSESIYPRQSFVASTDNYLAKHPDVPGKLLRALIKGEAFANAHSEETAQLVAKKTGQDIEAVRAYIMPVHINMNNGILPLVTDYAHWVIQNQEEFQQKSLPDYAKNIDPSYLKATAPDRVEKGM